MFILLLLSLIPLFLAISIEKSHLSLIAPLKALSLLKKISSCFKISYLWLCLLAICHSVTGFDSSCLGYSASWIHDLFLIGFGNFSAISSPKIAPALSSLFGHLGFNYTFEESTKVSYDFSQLFWLVLVYIFFGYIFQLTLSLLIFDLLLCPLTFLISVVFQI